MFGAPTIDYSEEVEFWSRQISEHAMFMYLGLLDPPMRTRAQELHQAWEEFRQARKGMPQREIAGRALALALDTRAFLNFVSEQLAKGRWLGWIWPLFVDHIRREGDYFVDILQHKAMTPETTYKTWLVFMAEHAAFAAHLLDPTEAAKIRQATAFIGEFERLHGGCAAINDQLVSLTDKAGTDLDRYFTQLGVGTPQLKSIIHPVLAEHVIREGRRFLQIVGQMKTEIGRAPGMSSLA